MELGVLKRLKEYNWRSFHLGHCLLCQCGLGVSDKSLPVEFKSLCSDCVEDLTTRVLDPQWHLLESMDFPGRGILCYSLVPYRGVMAEWIHLSKIACVPLAVDDLMRLWVLGFKLFLDELSAWNDLAGGKHPTILLQPAASSLWSRLRGRFDLAGMATSQIVDQCSASYRGKLLPLPCNRGQSWQFKKKAQIERSTRSRFHVEITPASDTERRQLNVKFGDVSRPVIIDDIITTGSTLWQNADFKEGEDGLSLAFTLCRSFQDRHLRPGFLSLRY